MYSREEIKALTDKVLNMARADAVEVEFNGGERSGTRWANSTITVNLVQLDQQLTVTVRQGQKTGTASTREFDDDSLKAMIDEATTRRRPGATIRTWRRSSRVRRTISRWTRRCPRWSTSAPASAPRW